MDGGGSESFGGDFVVVAPHDLELVALLEDEEGPLVLEEPLVEGLEVLERLECDDDFSAFGRGARGGRGDHAHGAPLAVDDFFVLACALELGEDHALHLAQQPAARGLVFLVPLDSDAAPLGLLCEGRLGLLVLGEEAELGEQREVLRVGVELLREQGAITFFSMNFFQLTPAK